MISNHDDEFIAVRVQDPRVQNDGSWNSFVDYKIFLHTNSKAFTAKTSCVRRRYSEFVWLKKQLQKNAGLVPVPDLPAKSIFYFCDEDFLEGRRKGLQAFLDKVVHMTVCLSDSQLHLFLQTQLSVSHIQDCVQGHTPFSVTDAILTYASSNQGLAQAQQDEPAKESSLAVSYESMESPVPHQPSLPAKAEFVPDLLSRDSDQAELLAPAPWDNVQQTETALIGVLQREALLEECSVTGVSFFLGEDQAEPESPGLEDQTRRRSCRIRTPVEVHSAAGAASGDDCASSEEEESAALRWEEKAVPADAEERPGGLGEEERPEFGDADGTEKQVLEMNDGPERVAGVEKCEEEKQAQVTEQTSAEPEINVDSWPPPERSKDTRMDRQRAEDEDEDGRSLPSSDESIGEVSDEESVCEEARDLSGDEKCCMDASGEEAPLRSADGSIRSITDVHLNGGLRETERGSTPQDQEPRYRTDVSDCGRSVSVPSGDRAENGDFSVIETSCSPGNS